MSQVNSNASTGGLLTSSFHPVFSPDGAWLVFERGDIDAGGEIVAVELASGNLRRLTTNLTYWRTVPRPISFSSDSSTVAFDVLQILTHGLLVTPLAGAAASNLILGATTPSLGGDGSKVVFLARASGGSRQVQLLDRAQGQTNLLSVSFGTFQPANGASFTPLITPNGRFVLFTSQATDLVPGATNSTGDLFLRDLQTRSTLLLSRNILTGAPGDAASGGPVLGRDGRTVIFKSFASNLADADSNQQADLFLVRLPGAESDFRVLSITRLLTGQTTLVWAAQANANYRVEFTDAIEADTSTSKKYGGTGLGLALSRKFCELMGGELTVRNVLFSCLDTLA